MHLDIITLELESMILLDKHQKIDIKMNGMRYNKEWSRRCF